ncbi:hypothetical protein Plhal304r1_c001g0001181 [Plasmopara halstedii]
MSSETTLEEFYARVMQRVCRSYRELNENFSIEDIDRLQQIWQEKLESYTGQRKMSSTIAEEDSQTLSPTEAAKNSAEAFIEDDEFLISSSSNALIKSNKEVANQSNTPSSGIVTLATSSIFLRILGSKRNLHQLDGIVSDDEDSMVRTDNFNSTRKDQSIISTDASLQKARAQEEGHVDSETDDAIFQNGEGEKKENEEDLSTDSPVSAALLLVSEKDFSPVSGLSGINLPLQVAAGYSKFVHRGKRRGYFGRLHAIVLTWPGCLKRKETLRPGDMVWYCPDKGKGILVEGEIVKVVACRQRLNELTIRRSNGLEAIVDLRQVRRLKEYLVRKGIVRLRSEQDR